MVRIKMKIVTGPNFRKPVDGEIDRIVDNSELAIDKSGLYLLKSGERRIKNANITGHSNIRAQ